MLFKKRENNNEVENKQMIEVEEVKPEAKIDEQESKDYKLTKENLSSDKLSLEEYMQKYNDKPHNIKLIKSVIFIIIAAIGVLIFVCLFMMVTKIYDMNKYAGYVSIFVGVMVYIGLFIIPLIKIKSSKAFIITVDERNVKNAKKYNKALREDIADKMIDFHSKTDNIGWYTNDKIGKLAIARQTKNDEELKKVLTDIYATDVKKQADRLIRDHAVKVGVTTALSQSDKVDTLFVGLYDISLIKELVLLYGYRPTEAKLMKIYRTVLVNSLVAFGLENVTANSITGSLSKIGGNIPLVGGLIGTVLESASQGLINASLAVVIGYKTKKYLRDEYHYQDILDTVEVTDELDEQSEKEMINDLKKSFNEEKKEKESKGGFLHRL